MSVCTAPDEGDKLSDYQRAVRAGAKQPDTLASYLRHARDKNEKLAELRRLHPSWFGEPVAPKPPTPQPPSQWGKEFLPDRPNLYVLWRGHRQHAFARRLASIGVVLRFDDFTIDGEYLIGKRTGLRCHIDSPRYTWISFIRAEENQRDQ